MLTAFSEGGNEPTSEQQARVERSFVGVLRILDLPEVCHSGPGWLSEGHFPLWASTSSSEVPDQKPKPIQMGPGILGWSARLVFQHPRWDQVMPTLKSSAWRSLPALTVVTQHPMEPCAASSGAPVQPPVGALATESSKVAMGISFDICFLSETERVNKPALLQRLIALENNVLLLQRAFLEGF